MAYEFDLLVFIGRFQPFHVQHQRNINMALERAEEVLVLVGSSGKSRSVRNPWTFLERKQMIRSCYPEETRLAIEPLYDLAYNDTAWVLQVQEIVQKYCESRIFSNQLNNFEVHTLPRIGLIGASKDKTSYYLNLFPAWGSVDTTFIPQTHATYVRELFFEGGHQHYELCDNILPRKVCDWLFEDFIHTKEFEQIKEEHQFVLEYKKSWATAPYPPIFSTVDAVVEQSGHVLLVRRRASPGRGLFALPGGFVNQDERLEDSMIRELLEETKIKVPEAVLRGSIESHEIFDEPHRSDRGRTITTAYHIKLKDGPLPRVKGGDDADKALWVPLVDLAEDRLFEDHWHIIHKMLGIG